MAVRADGFCKEMLRWRCCRTWICCAVFPFFPLDGGAGRSHWQRRGQAPFQAWEVLVEQGQKSDALYLLLTGVPASRPPTAAGAR